MSGRLVITWNYEHVEHLRVHHKVDDIIVSFDLDASAQLRKYGIPYMESTDFVSMQAVADIQPTAQSLAEGWYKPLEALCLIDGVSLLAMEQSALYHFFYNALVARHIFDQVLAHYTPQEVVLFGYQERPIAFTDLHDNAAVPIFRYMAEQRKLTVTMVNIKGNEETRVPKQARPSVANLLYQLALNQLQWWRIWSRRHSPELCVTILINEGYRLSSVIDGLFELLGQQEIIASVVGGRSTGGMMLPEYTWRYLSFSLLPDPRFLLLEQQSRKWYAAFLAYQRSYSDDYPEVLANPHLDFHFRHYFRVRLRNLAQTYRESCIIFRRLRARVLLVTQVLDLYLSGVVAAARTCGLHIISLPHSGIPVESEISYRGDVTVVWTRDFIESLRPTQNATPMILTGLPSSVIARGYAPKSRFFTTATTRKRVVLLLSTVQVSAMPYVDVRRHLKTLQVLAEPPPAIAEQIDIIFKLHPSYDYRFFYESLLPSDATNIYIVRDSPLEAVLEAADLALLVNSYTSAYLLSLSMQVPLLFINTAKSWIGRYYKLADWGADFTITDDATIWPRVEQVLFMDEDKGRLRDANARYWELLEAAVHDPIQKIGQAVKVQTL